MKYEARMTVITEVEADSEELAKEQVIKDWDILSNCDLDYWLEAESIVEMSEVN